MSRLTQAKIEALEAQRDFFTNMARLAERSTDIVEMARPFLTLWQVKAMTGQLPGQQETADAGQLAEVAGKVIESFQNRDGTKGARNAGGI